MKHDALHTHEFSLSLYIKYFAIIFASIFIGSKYNKVELNQQSEIYKSKPIEYENIPVQAKYALLVGIDKYKDVSNLNGCVNDVRLIKKMLIDKYNFLPENIIVLENERATRQNIINTFRSHLIAKAQASDVVLFHTSSHGTQQREYKRGEEIDGLDEIIVPHDFSYSGTRGISDNEINGLLFLLTQKTKNVTFVLDACNSGGATRALGFKKRQLEKPDTLRPAAKPEGFSVPDEEAYTSAIRSIIGQGRNKANYVFISGCRSDELSNEHLMPNGQIHGLLSYFLERELRNSPAGQLTYNDIMDVKTSVTNKFNDQHPQIEGANGNAFVFGDPISQVENYLQINPGPTSQIVTVRGGEMLGVTVGSKFEVYEPTAKKFIAPEKPVATIEIIQVGPSESKAKIISGMVKEIHSRGIEIKHNFGNQLLKISFLGNWNSNTSAAAKNQVLSLPFTKQVKPTDIILKNNNDLVNLYFPDDTTNAITSYPIDVNLQNNLVKDMHKWAKWNSILNLENPRSKLKKIKFTISVIKPGSRAFPATGYTFKSGDKLAVEIQNNSNVDLFFHFINLKDDGTIGIYRLTELAHNDNPLGPSNISDKVPANNTWNGYLQASVGTGDQDRDVLKLFATTDSEVKLSFLKSENNEEIISKDGLFINRLLMKARNLDPVGGENKQLLLDEWTTINRTVLVNK